MAIKVKIGGELFDDIRKSDCCYVDKTELLYDLLNSEDAVTLFTRPCRIGKPRR